MDWFDIDGVGKLVTYSKLEYAPIGFEKRSALLYRSC